MTIDANINNRCRKAMTPNPIPTPTDLRKILEEVRATVTAECRQKGLPDLVAKAIVRLIACFMALLADFLAGRPAGAAETAPCAGDAAVAASAPAAIARRGGRGMRRATDWRRGRRQADAAAAGGARAGVDARRWRSRAAGAAERRRKVRGRWRDTPGPGRALPPYHARAAPVRRGPFRKWGSGPGAYVRLCCSVLVTRCEAAP